VFVAIARRALLAICHYFVDDITTVDLECALGPSLESADGSFETPFSAQGSVRAFAKLLRIVLPLAKSTTPSAVSDNCGVTTDVSELASSGTVFLRVKESTRDKLLALAHDVRSKNACSPSEAGSLASKFRWGFLMSSVGPAATQPLTVRQHLKGAPADVATALSPEIKASISFMTHVLTSPFVNFPLRAYADPEPHVLALSDASFEPPVPPLLYGSGVVAFIVFFPASARFGPAITFVSSMPISQQTFEALARLRAQMTFIHALEAIGIAAPYLAPELKDRFRGRSVLHCADNQSANFAFTRGYSSSPDIAHIVSTAHCAIAQLEIRFWLHYVQSDANLADMPTRSGSDFVESHTGAVQIPFTMPSFTSWASL